MKFDKVRMHSIKFDKVRKKWLRSAIPSYACNLRYGLKSLETILDHFGTGGILCSPAFKSWRDHSISFPLYKNFGRGRGSRNKLSCSSWRESRSGSNSHQKSRRGFCDDAPGGFATTLPGFATTLRGICDDPPGGFVTTLRGFVTTLRGDL